MAAKKRSGLGRGIGALIPQAPVGTERPVDVFFSNAKSKPQSTPEEDTAAQVAAAEADGDSERNSTAQNRDAEDTASSGEAGAAADATADADKTGSPASTSTTSRSRSEARKAAEKSGGAAARAAQQAKRRSVAGTSVSEEPEASDGLEAPEADPENELQEVPGAVLTQLLVSEIAPNRAQPRRDFDEDALAELTHSVKEFGVFQPVVVRELIPRPAEGEPKYELIMGERRVRASKRAGLTYIPAIIRSTEDENMLRDALLENLHRAELSPLEEASAYQQLMSDFGITQEQLAERIGRSRPQISNTIRLLRLPETVQSRVASGVLSAGHARAILALDGDPDGMQKLADKIVNEGLSVRAAETAATKAPKRKAPKPRAGGRQGQLDEIAERLGDRLDTRVSVRLGSKNGKIVIDFATIGDLTRILEELGDPGFQ
jgi:ParB family chromosome partitioning protein